MLLFFFHRDNLVPQIDKFIKHSCITVGFHEANSKTLIDMAHLCIVHITTFLPFSVVYYTVSVQSRIYNQI